MAVLSCRRVFVWVCVRGRRGYSKTPTLSNRLEPHGARMPVGHGHSALVSVATQCVDAVCACAPPATGLGNLREPTRYALYVVIQSVIGPACTQVSSLCQGVISPPPYPVP